MDSSTNGQGMTDRQEESGGRIFASPRDRRQFLRAAGLGGAALALSACGDATGLSLLEASPVASSHGSGGVVLDFSSDVGVLNFAYALEQLEAAFYIQVIATTGFASRFSMSEQIVLRDLRDHEIAHRDFLAAALGTSRIPNLAVDFSAVDFTSWMSVFTTARTFEDLGVSAYNGAARFLKSATNLTVAGKIVSVEARHASAIRSILEPRTGAFAPNVFDPARAPGEVVMLADPFITTPISVINA